MVFLFKTPELRNELEDTIRIPFRKDEKKRFVEDKVNFLNYLLGKDRGLVSLLADISILAASNRYVLIQSKNPNTNALINQDIDKIEKYYKKYSKNDVRFAAVNDDLWKKDPICISIFQIWSLMKPNKH